MTLTRRHFCGLSCATVGAGLTGCVVNPATGGRDLILVSEAQEDQMGKEAYPQLIKEFGGVYNDPQTTRYVDEIGARLAQVTETPGEKFTFTVLDNPIVNAFATPGGYVYISRGLMALAENEAELAGVLGHELGHIVARHSAQRMSKATLASAISGLLGAGQVGQAVGELYLRSFSREQELEADRLGVRYINRAGYDPGAMTSFLAKMRANSRLQAVVAGRNPDDVDQRDIMATHPRTVERVQQAMELAGVPAGEGAIRRDAYLRVIDSMIYGDSPEQGFIRDRTFVHPRIGLAFQVPEGFIMHNTPGAVLAISDAQQVLIKFDAANAPYGGDMASYIQNEWAKQRDVQNLSSIRLGALPAATGATYIETQSERLLARVAAIRFDSERIFRFLAVAPGGGAGNLDRAFQSTVATFRKLSREEAAAVQPWRVRVTQVGPGDTVSGLARRMPFDDYRDERFRVLNGMEQGEALRAGEKVKLVLEG